MTESFATPAGDGEVLLSPAGDQLAEALARAGRCADRSGCLLAGVDLSDLRRAARDQLARLLGRDLPGPWILTGHQPELHHPGVWFKDAVIAALAERTDGSAVHVVADLDAAKHLELHVPVLVDGGLETTRIAISRYAPGAPAVNLPAPPRATVESAIAGVERSPLDATAMDLWAPAALQAAGTGHLAEWISAGRNAVSRALGLDVHDVLLSDLVRGRAFATFVAAVAVGGPRLREIHNRCLAQYRRRHSIHTPAQPLPDLHQRGGAVELPLWVVPETGPRRPLYARPGEETIDLLADGELWTTIPAAPADAVDALTKLLAEGPMIAPRALTLTMFLRLIVADVFVHGTGGARYDQVGDAIVAEWLGCDAPPFVVATATARLDLPRRSTSPEDFAQLRWRRHHAAYNIADEAKPEQVADPARLAELSESKRSLVEQIDAAGPLSRERRELFEQLHETLGQMRDLARPMLEQLDAQIETARADLAHNEVADDREYFFALHRRSALQNLIDQARQWATRLDEGLTVQRSGLPDREYRLRSNERIREIFHAGVRVGNARAMLTALPNELCRPRLAVAVGKRHGNAVRRNRIKRLCRQAFRQVRDRLPRCYDLVLAPRPREDHSLANLTDTLQRLAERLDRRHRKSETPS